MGADRQGVIFVAGPGELDRSPVAAEVWGSPSLWAVHEATGRPAGAPEVDGPIWVLTHIPTGRRFAWYLDKWRADGAAAEVARATAGRVDWYEYDADILGDRLGAAEGQMIAAMLAAWSPRPGKGDRVNTNGNGDRRMAELDARIVAKIERVQTTGEMYHVAGRVMGHELAEVEGDDGSGIVITSDGWAQIGGNIFLGPAEGLVVNLERVIAAAGLDQDEAARFWARYAEAVRDLRPGAGRGE